MELSSGTSSDSPKIEPSELRKRKRMESNRESARRSRMRKQKHLDDLTAQIAELSKENNQILTSINVNTQHYVKVEAENSILRAHMTELTQRLESLNEILNYVNPSTATAAAGSCVFEAEEFLHQGFSDVSSWSLMGPIMASSEMFDYY